MKDIINKLSKKIIVILLAILVLPLLPVLAQAKVVVKSHNIE
jgi:hypothetical protein